MSARGWLLFAAMSVIWGIPYLLIKISLEGLSVPVLVFARTLIGAAVLLPLALSRTNLRIVRRHWKPLLAFAFFEIIAAWLLLSDAERHLTSSTTGLLIAATPIIAAILERVTGGTHRLGGVRVLGLTVGLAGVAVLAGHGLTGGGAWPVTEVLLVSTCYAIAPLIAARHLADVPASLPMTAACLGFAATGLRDTRGAALAERNAQRPCACRHHAAGGGVHRAGLHPVLRPDPGSRPVPRGGVHLRQPRGGPGGRCDRAQRTADGMESGWAGAHPRRVGAGHAARRRNNRTGRVALTGTVAAVEFNLAEVFTAVAAAVPDRDCIVFGDRRLTFAEIDDRTSRLARVLHDWGLGAHTERSGLAGYQSGQSHLALYMTNSNEYVEGMLGAYRARVAPFNVNYRYVSDELVYLLDNAHAAAVMYHAQFGPTLAEALDKLPRDAIDPRRRRVRRRAAARGPALRGTVGGGPARAARL